MGYHGNTTTFGRTSRVATLEHNNDLFMPPSMNHRGDNASTDTTIPVHSTKDLLIKSPSTPWRHVTKVLLVESSDSTEVNSKDKYLVPEQREQAVEHHTPLPQSTWLMTKAVVPTTQKQTSMNLVEHHQQEQVQDIPAVDSIELISLPPSVRKHKKNKLFSKLKRGVTRASPSSRLDVASSIPRLTTTRTRREEEQETSVEVRLLAWTEYKITVQIFDGKTKTKIQFKRDQEIEVKLPTIALVPYAERPPVQDQPVGDENDGEIATKQQPPQQDDESDSTVGPSDIPHEVSYRTAPSIGSIVFPGIPSAASIPDVSDVSSNSSDASDWTESDDEEDFFGTSPQKNKVEPKETKPPVAVAPKLKKWNKRIFSGLKRRSSAAE